MNQKQTTSLLLLYLVYYPIYEVVAVDCKQGHHGPSPTPPTRPLPRVRPPAAERTFTSPAIEAKLAELMARTWINPELATMLWNCLPNTLDTTVWQAPNATNNLSFISTGDISAMWLRDSQNQVIPYMRFAKAEPNGIGSLLRGLILRHVDSVLLDPFANSFDYFTTKADCLECNSGGWMKDNTTFHDVKTGRRKNAMVVGIHQRKWEMDSLCSMLKIGRMYHDATEDTTPFSNARWKDAVRLVIATLRTMQTPLGPSNFTDTNYTFQELTQEPKDTSPHGIGRNHRWTGMVRTSFLPSDDSVRFPYHIPGNAFAVVELRGVVPLLRKLDEHALADDAKALAKEIDDGIHRFGIVRHGLTGDMIYAMEVDGFGNFFFADDANVPSLLALPFFGYVDAEDPLYQRTRALVLSNATNPYYFGCGGEGSDVSGCAVLGGTGSEDASGNAGLGHVWPLSLTTRLLTVAGNSSEADAERKAILHALVESTGGTGLMHESYWYTDSSSFTRFWFAMANSYVGEALLHLAETRPDLLFVAEY
tara:strand:- start:177 stop:1781 length:1605 start_codon:yes stop_codon:yes gene_type:complete